MEKKWNIILISERFWSYAVFFLFFVLYISEIPSVNVGYADSDLFLAIGKNLGLAHPPGYPLYILGLNLFDKIPLPFNFVFKANLLSVILHSLTLVFIFRALVILGKFVGRENNESKNLILSFLSVIYLGANFLFWQNAIIAEKYALNNLFASILIFLFGQIVFKKKRFENLMLVFFGLALSYHQSILLLFPLILSVVIRIFKESKKKTFVSLGLVILTYFAGISLLLVLNKLERNVSWNFESNLKNIIGFVTKNHYKGINDITGENNDEYLKNFNLTKFLEILPEQIVIFGQQNGLVFSIVFVLGFWFLIKELKPFYSMFTKHLFLKKNVKKMDLFLLSSFVTIFIIPFYLDWNGNFGTQLTSMRQFMLGYLFVPFFVLYFLIKISKKIEGGKQLVFLVIILGFSLARIVETKNKINYKDFYFVHNQYQDIMNKVENNSLLICESDISCFALLYLQEVENVRTDVVIIPNSINLVNGKVSKINDLNGFDYQNPPFTLIDIVSWNLGKRKVYAVDLATTHRAQLGMTYGFSKYIPIGHFGEIVKDIYGGNFVVNYKLEKELEEEIPSEDKHKLYVKSLFSYNHVLNSLTYAQLGEKKLAEKELRFATFISDQGSRNLQDLIDKTRLDIEKIDSFSEYVPEIKNPAEEQILDLADFFTNNNEFDKAYFGYLGVLIRNPLSEMGRVKFARFNEIVGEKQQAKIEYENVLKYYPENKEAKNWLSRF